MEESGRTGRRGQVHKYKQEVMGNNYSEGSKIRIKEKAENR
jgi:hypothetical protein